MSKYRLCAYSYTEPKPDWGSLVPVRCNDDMANAGSFLARSCWLEGSYYVLLTRGCPSSQEAALTPALVKSQPLRTEGAEKFAQTTHSESSGREPVDMTRRASMLSWEP